MGWDRAYAREQVVFRDRGVLVPGGYAWWRPLDPETDLPYTGPLYDDESATATMSFPARADPLGVIQVWAPEPVRLNLQVWSGNYPPALATVDLLFTADTQAEIDLAAHLAEPDAHPQYLKLAGGSMSGPLAVQGNAVALDPDPDNVLSWGPEGIMSLGATIDAYTKVEADERFAPVAHVHDQYATDADLADATGQIAALESALADAVARIATLEAQMVSHIHAAGDWDYLAGASVPDGTP